MLLFLLSSLLVVTGLVYAHFSGFLAPLYHFVGLHGFADHDEHTGHDMKGAAQHGGHGRMATPAEKAEPSGVPDYAIVKISLDRQQLIGVRCAAVSGPSFFVSPGVTASCRRKSKGSRFGEDSRF